MRNFVAAQSSALLRLADSMDWLAPLVMRLFFGYFWLETGWGKLHNIDGATERFVNWGIPYPGFSAVFSAGTELVGGLLVMLGLLTRLTAIPMIINMIVAIAVVAIKPVNSLDDFVEIDEPLYILIFFWLMMAGPGRISLDHYLARFLGIRSGDTTKSR